MKSIPSGEFIISTLPSLQFVTINLYNVLDGISVQKHVWAISNVALWRGFTENNFKNFQVLVC